MKNIFLMLITCFSLLSCNSQGNPKIIYKEYIYEFQADEYPKSITDLYKSEEKSFNLSDREAAIKMNADIILKDVIENVLRYHFKQNIPTLTEKYFNRISTRLTKYYTAEKRYFTKDLLVDRTQQWIADSIVQNKYNGKIYYDPLLKVPKPKEAYKKMILDLINKNEIQISDDFLKKEIVNLAENYLNKETEIDCDFYDIESWTSKK